MSQDAIQPTAVPAASSAPQSDVHADLTWTSAHHAPEVMLSFSGNNEPTGLWASLTAIGWVVPPCPPRPGSAIEWTPDPTTGEDYTIRPWRVEEFYLRPGDWSDAEQRAVGSMTVKVLQASGASISGLRGSTPTPDASPARAATPPAAPAPTPQPPQAAPVAPQAATPAIAPTPAPAPTPATPTSAPAPTPETAAAPAPAQSSQPAAAAAASVAPVAPGSAQAFVEGSPGVFTLVLDPTATFARGRPAGVDLFYAESGRKKVPWVWIEANREPGQLFETEPELAAVFARGGLVLSAPEGAELPTPLGASVLIQVAIPGATTDDAKMRKVLKLLGDDVQSVPLSAANGDAGALLIWTRVAAQNAALLASNLRLRLPNGIMRALD